MMSDDNEITTRTTDAPAAPRSRRGPRLDRLAHVRRALGRCVRDLEGWKPDDLKASDRIARARAIGFLLAELASVMRASDLEARLEALETLTRNRLGN